MGVLADICGPARAWLTACLLMVPAAGAVGQSAPFSPAVSNDYPTMARADYIFGCMAANGQTRGVMEQCVCSIDIVASILPYEKYVQAETVLSVSRTGGEKTAIFKTSPSLQNLVADLRRAQVEAEFRCF